MAKAALGAERTVAWQQADIHEVLEALRGEGYTLVAIEQHARALDYKTFTPPQKTALIFGNETEGLDKEVLELSDTVLEISMRGKKESLNVAVAAGIALFALFDR